MAVSTNKWFAASQRRDVEVIGKGYDRSIFGKSDL
jgi:hypothetical protein